MVHALNLTVPLKQDAETKEKLAHLRDTFATELQPKIEEAMHRSKLLHFARVLVSEDETYLQVLTEFDGDRKVYTTFFLNALGPIFEFIFSMAEGVPPWDEMKHPDEFFRVTDGLNVRSLGVKEDDPDSGFLYSAYGGRSVKDILAALGEG